MEYSRQWAEQQPAFLWKGRHAIRTSFSTGTVTSSGGDFDMISLVYAYAWN